MSRITSQHVLPIGRSFSPEDVERHFNLATGRPNTNPICAWRLLVPKGWMHDPDASRFDSDDPGRFKPLASFIGPDGGQGRGVILLQCAGLPREIAAGHWLRYIMAQQERIIEEVVDVSTGFADAHITFAVHDLPFEGRAAAWFHGGVAFLLMAFVPSSMYRDHAEKLGLIVASFRPVNPPPRSTIEPRERATLGGMLEIRYPGSWREDPPHQSESGRIRTRLSNFDNDGMLNGVIEISFVPRRLVASDIQAAAEVRARFAEEGFVPEEVIHNDQFALSGSAFHEGTLSIDRGRLPGRQSVPQELWTTVLAEKDFFFVMCLLTPSRESRFFVWAINRRACEIVLSSVQWIT